MGTPVSLPLSKEPSIPVRDPEGSLQILKGAQVSISENRHK